MQNTHKQIQSIISILQANNQTVSFAESCTGGGIASAFCAVSGVSAVFGGACVTYSNSIKESWLKVKHHTLVEHGAVSQACVREMLEGITSMAKSDYALAVSGIAGPEGGSKEKPVGTVYIGMKTPSSLQIYPCLFHGDRASIQAQSIAFSISTLNNFLKK
jgi:nicotinamide-nucleotide amidase